MNASTQGRSGGASRLRQGRVAASAPAMRFALLALVALAAVSGAGCMSRMTPSAPPAVSPAPQGDAEEPLPPGIKPLTLEQEELVSAGR